MASFFIFWPQTKILLGLIHSFDFEERLSQLSISKIFVIFRYLRNLPTEFSIPEKLPPEKVMARSNFLKKKLGKKMKGRMSEVNLRMGPKMK
jgi:hypothetical protein